MESANNTSKGEIVVLVHGLYMHGIAMIPLHRRLSACGFSARKFSYPSLRRTTPENADALHRYLQELSAATVHFLCHSLGGLVVRTMMLQCDWQRPGRVLTLGTPHLGCYVAKQLNANSALAWSLGKSFRHGLDGDVPPWPKDREVGTIAGDKPVGAGRAVPGLPKPNDGTIAVAETRLGRGYPHVVLAETHSSMLLSSRVASYACAYLETGRFPEVGRARI